MEIKKNREDYHVWIDGEKVSFFDWMNLEMRKNNGVFPSYGKYEIMRYLRINSKEYNDILASALEKLKESKLKNH